MRRLSRVQSRAIVGTLILTATLTLALIAAGDTLTVLVLLALAPVVAFVWIWATRRSMNRGKTVEQLINRWFNLPVIGPVLRFGDRMISRMGRGSKALLEDLHRREPPPPN